MSGLGTWTAEHVTHIEVLRASIYDGDTDEVIGEKGQTLIVCDDARSVIGAPTMPYDHHRQPATRKVHDVHGGVGTCECSKCGGYIEPYDGYCKHCGVRFMVTEYEMIGENDV